MRRWLFRAVLSACFVPAVSLLASAQQVTPSDAQAPSSPASPAEPGAPASPGAPAAPGGIASPGALAGQQEPPRAPSTPANTITSNVSLVVLDGVAVDQKGHPVTDLKREDFHITEDDEPQQIRNFDPPGLYTPSPDVTIDSTADLDRLAPRAPVNIVLLDEFNTRFEDMAFARYSLKKWLEKQPDKLPEPTMLIAVSLGKFEVLRDYTQNKDEILRALDHHFVAYPWQAHEFAWVAERYSTAFVSLRRVAEASLGHQGHKNMIWLGRGFPTLNRSRFSVDDNSRINSEVQRTVNELRNARVTLYTIDPAGVMIDPGVYGESARLFAPFGGDPDFQSLARATGGRNLYGRNDVDAEIGTSIQDGASLYTLTYKPLNSKWDPDKFRKISVTIDRPGLKFITRQGYYPETRPARPGKDGAVGRHLATELVSAADSNMAYDAVGFLMKASATDANDFNVSVASHGMAWYYTDGSKPRFTRLIVVTTTFDRKGKLLKTDAKRLEFQAPATAPARGHIDVGVGFEYKLAPDPKAVRMRMVLRVEASGRMGTADVTLAPGATGTSVAEGAVTPVSPAKPAPAPSAPDAAPGAVTPPAS